MKNLLLSLIRAGSTLAQETLYAHVDVVGTDHVRHYQGLEEFHDVVLSNGTVPLSILEGVVNQWVASKKAGTYLNRWGVSRPDML